MVSIAIFIVCLICAAFFAATEVAFFSLTPLTVTRGERNRLEKLYLSKNDLIAMLLTGNSLAIVCGTLALDALLPPEKDLYLKVLAFFVELILFFLLSEALPKAVGRRKNIVMLEKSYRVIWMFYYLLLPMSYVFLKISRFIGKIGVARPDDARLEVFRFISEHTGESKLPLTESLATYSSTTIREIMTPMSELFSLPAGARLSECAETLEKSSYSRYPVYETIPAEISGYVDLRDLLDIPASTRVRQVMRPALFFPYSLKVDQLHAEMRRLSQPIVFVVNEYGLILGMVTEENLAEELVGDIFSHDQKLETEYLQQVQSGVFEIDCVMDIDDFGKAFALNIQKENFETLGGYLLSECGHIPLVNERVELPPGEFTILEATRRAVRRVRFKPKKSGRA
ncbi:MAG: CNNM domain-containing protein [Turneriella sp.]